MAAQALVLFGHLASEPRYVESAQRAVDLFAADVARAPGGYSTLLEASALLEAPPAVVLLAGDPEACAAMHRGIAAQYRPGVVAIDLSAAADLPAVLVKGDAPKSGAAAYVCRGNTCLPAMDSLDSVVAALQ